MGKPRNTRKYPTYLEIPKSKKDTQKYPIIIFDTPTRPATRYFVQSPTRPDIEKPYPLGTEPNKPNLPNQLQVVFFSHNTRQRSKANLAFISCENMTASTSC